MDPLLEKIIETIRAHYQGREKVTPSTVQQSLHIDNLDSLELIIEIDEATGIIVEDEDYDNAMTVHDLYLALKGKVPA